MAALHGATSLIAALTAVESQTVALTSGFAALVANVGPAAKTAQNAQLAAAAAVNGTFTVPETSQLAALIAYATGVPERNTQRAWFFDLDGHTFYVLDLGTTKTIVLDLLTNQWFEWKTEGYDIWNAQLGTKWQDRIVAADFQTPGIFEIDARETLDEGFRAVRRVATAIVPSPSRNYTAMDELHLIASVGDAQQDFAGTATMTLSFSDDQGQSFYTFGFETLSSTDNTQEIIFRSLGSFNMPGRVVKVEDLGGPVRIDSAQVVLR